MRHTNVLRLLPDSEQHAVLKTLADRAAALWNATNYRCRQSFIRTGRVPCYEALCAEFASHPAYHALPSDMAQETLKKLAAAWKSFFALRRLHAAGKIGDKPRPPRYWKDRRTGQRAPRGIFVKSPRSYDPSRKALALTLPSDLRERPGHRLVIPFRGVLRHQGRPGTCEILWDPARRRWHARITVHVPEPERKERPKKLAAIDSGARVLAAVAGDPTVRLYRGREVWREFLYWTRHIAGEQARLARQGLRTSRRLKLLHRRRRLRLLHALQALACQVARDLRRAGVTCAALEDVTGIRADMDFGPGNLLVHNFWAFRLWRRVLEGALEREGIAPIAVAPRDTSSRCARCGGRVARPAHHKAVCPHCRATFHADANAALNILRRAADLLEAPSKGDGAEAKAPAPVAYRWNRHRWVNAGAKSAAATRRNTDASRDPRAA